MTILINCNKNTSTKQNYFIIGPII